MKYCKNCKENSAKQSSEFCSQFCFDTWYEQQQMNQLKFAFEKIFPSIKLSK